MTDRPVTVTTDHNGLTVVTQGDTGAAIQPFSAGKERYEIEPVRWAMQTGKPITVSRERYDVRDHMNKFGVK